MLSLKILNYPVDESKIFDLGQDPKAVLRIIATGKPSSAMAYAMFNAEIVGFEGMTEAPLTADDRVWLRMANLVNEVAGNLGRTEDMLTGAEAMAVYYQLYREHLDRINKAARKDPVVEAMRKLDLVIVKGTPEEACHDFLFQAMQGPRGMVEGYGMDAKAAELCCRTLHQTLTEGDVFGMDHEICGTIADLANIVAKGLGRPHEDITGRVVFDKIMEHPAYAPLKCSELEKVTSIIGGRSYINEKGFEIAVVGEGVFEDWKTGAEVESSAGTPVVIYRDLQPRYGGIDKTIRVKPRELFLLDTYEMPTSLQEKRAAKTLNRNKG